MFSRHTPILGTVSSSPPFKAIILQDNNDLHCPCQTVTGLPGDMSFRQETYHLAAAQHFMEFGLTFGEKEDFAMQLNWYIFDLNNISMCT